jgi:hypothetical protein
MAPRCGAGTYGREEPAPAARNPWRPLAPLLGFGGDREGHGGGVWPRPEEEWEGGRRTREASIRFWLRWGRGGGVPAWG